MNVLEELTTHPDVEFQKSLEGHPNVVFQVWLCRGDQPPPQHFDVMRHVGDTRVYLRAFQKPTPE
jgi:hypothetical protein